LEDLEKRLCGIEIDRFAAWMSRVFLQLLAYPITVEADRPLRLPIREGDSLRLAVEERKQFDLVIANPPFGRVSLRPEQRRFFSRSLYGHANLYGLFLDLALRWRKPDGLIAFITPTSFLGGQYFSRLRDLLRRDAPPLTIDVVETRTGIFDDVQQETCLTVFGPNKTKSTTVHLLSATDDGLRIERAGAFTVYGSKGSPWFLPRSQVQARILEKAATMKTRLHHLGYKCSTGPLVWNRHKDQLRKRVDKRTFPLIWAEAVRPNAFRFRYRSRSATPFFAIREGQDHLLCLDPCILIQRTTAKEQQRRLVACAVPESFLTHWRGIVVENHVNVARAVSPQAVDAAAVAAVLNTVVVDQAFRCLSGSVAVSVTELHALPLPSRDVFDRVADVLAKTTSRKVRLLTVENLVARAYGVSLEEVEAINEASLA